MNVLDFPFALLAFLAFVAVMPAWQHFLSAHTSGMTTEGQFLAALVLPATLLLFLAGWLQPGGAS